MRRCAIPTNVEAQFVSLLDRLEKRLQQARNLFDQSEHGGRAGAILATGAAVEFIMGIDRLKEQDLARPLAMLVGALNDLDDGKQSPLLAPMVFGNRPPDSHAVQSVRAYAAWTMDHLMQLDCRRIEAATQVANTLKSAGFSFGQDRGSPPNTVASWRDRLKQGKAGSFETSVWEDLLGTPLTFGTDNRGAIRRDFHNRLGHIARCVRVDSSN